MRTSLQGFGLDLDGTLTDTLALCVRAFQDVVEARSGRRPTDAAVHAQFGATEEGILAELLGARDPQAEELWHARYRELLAREVDGPFDGVLEWLARAVERGLRLAVVTGKGERSARHTLDALGMAPFIERLAAGSPQGSIKAEALAEIVADWGFEPSRVAYLGDAPSDVLDARRAGVIALAAGWAPSTDLEALRASAPDRLFETWRDFAHWSDEQTA